MSPGRTQGTEDTQTVKTLWLIVKKKTKPWHLARKNHVLLINFSSDKKFLLSSAMSPFSCCHQIQIFSLINLSSRSIWKEQVGEMMISSPTDLGGRGFSTVLDPWTGSAVLNILSTVCLPSADLPDMLSSRLAGDATSLRISPATREAPLHFLWINLHTVGEEERPGTGALAQRWRASAHIVTHILSPKNNTQPWLQYELPQSKPDESSEITQWLVTTWNLFFLITASLSFMKFLVLGSRSEMSPG